MKKQYKIDTDGVTVWINGPVHCMARFGRMGIDIHRYPADAVVGECLFCTHAPTAAVDWKLFRTKMKELHGVVVPDRYTPKRFR